jgi:hypothetical protein
VRFNHVFYSLLVLCVLSAFVLPARYTESKPRISALFTPVAAPSRSVVAWVTGNSKPQSIPDPRPADEITKENNELRFANATLSYQVAELQRVMGDRLSVGDLRDQCTPVGVLGPDLGTRDSLALRSGNYGGLQDGMFVLHDRDVVGTLVSGKAGAQVRLVTDRQSKVQARFGSFRPVRVDGPTTRKTAAGAPATDSELRFVLYKLDPKLVVGQGDGKMLCRNLAFGDVQKEGLKVGDWAVVDDPELPQELHNRRIGVVTAIRAAEHMMTDIEIRPEGNLLSLREVMVLTKRKK